MVSEAKGKRLTFHCTADDPNLTQTMAPLRHLLNRDFQPLRKITIETINNEVLNDQNHMLKSFEWELEAMKLEMSYSDLDDQKTKPILEKINNLMSGSSMKFFDNILDAHVSYCTRATYWLARCSCII